MTVLCCLLSLAIAGPTGSGDTGTKTKTDTGSVTDTGTTGTSTSSGTSTASGTSTSPTGAQDTGSGSVSAASLADEVGGCHCGTSPVPAAPWLVLLLLARRRGRG